MSKEFYTGLIEASDKEEAFLQVFYTFSNHMGEAMEIMLNFAIQIGINSPRIIEVDTFKFKDLPKLVINSPKFNSYYLNERYYFPLCDYSKFQLPFGIVLSGAKGEFEPELMSEGFTRYGDEDGIEHLEVVVDRTKLLDTYLSIIEKLKSIRVFWIRVARDWANSEVVEFYANEKLNNPYNIKKFIKDNFDDIFLNGHLSITAYSNDSAINVCIDEHKKIRISTQSNEFIQIVSKYIENIGFKYYEYDNFYSIEHGYYHWHYRPSNSKGRYDLIRHLKENGFFLWRTE